MYGNTGKIPLTATIPQRELWSSTVTWTRRLMDCSKRMHLCCICHIFIDAWALASEPTAQGRLSVAEG
eukprot:symbB.v1.2.040873.t1/scaffold7567.1/size11372/1